MKSCENQAEYRLRYDEPGTPVTEKLVCGYHETFERIHDPENIRSKPLRQ